MAYELSKPNYKGISTVFGGFLIHLTLGTFYTLGNVNTYVTSYIRHYYDKNVNYADAIWINAAFFLGQGSLMILGGVLESKIGARQTSLMGSVIFSGSVALTYYTVRKSFWTMVVSYGFMASLGVGIAYIAPLATSMKWFPKRKGLVTGITVGGYGLGSLIFNQVQTAYLNPLNTSPDKDGYFSDESILLRVPSMFVMLGSVYLVIQLIGCLLIFKPPTLPDEIIFSDGRLLLIQSPDDHQEGYSSCEDSPMAPEVVERMTKTDMKPWEAFRTNEFIQMWLMFALTSQTVQFVNTMYKAYGQEFIKNDHFLAFAGSMASLCNAIGRIVWGQLLDKTSVKITFSAMCVLLSALTMTFIAAEVFNSKLLYMIWVLAIFFSFSGIFVIFPTATAIVFGKSHAGTIYGMLFTAPALASILGAFLFQAIQNELGWFSSFFVVSCLTLTALLLMFTFPSNLRKA